MANVTWAQKTRMTEIPSRDVFSRFHTIHEHVGHSRRLVPPLGTASGGKSRLEYVGSLSQFTIMQQLYYILKSILKT